MHTEDKDLKITFNEFVTNVILYFLLLIITLLLLVSVILSWLHNEKVYIRTVIFVLLLFAFVLVTATMVPFLSQEYEKHGSLFSGRQENRDYFILGTGAISILLIVATILTAIFIFDHEINAAHILVIMTGVITILLILYLFFFASRIKMLFDYWKKNTTC